MIDLPRPQLDQTKHAIHLNFFSSDNYQYIGNISFHLREKSYNESRIRTTIENEVRTAFTF